MDDEREELRQVVRRFLNAACPPSTLRSALASGRYPRPVWQALSTSLGLTAIGIPERFGGSGGTLADVGVVVEEFGAALAPVPLLSVATAAAAALACGADAANGQLLPGVASGETIAVPILAGDVRAEPLGAGWVVQGTAAQVPDAGAADVFVVAARTDSGRALLAVRSPGPGVSLEPQRALDATRPQAAAHFTAAPAALLGVGGSTWPALDRARDAQLALLVCEQVGGAGRCLDMIVSFAKVREQFGVPIGSFQAVKHRCADLVVELEAARSIAYHARDSRAAPSSREGDAAHATVVAAAAWCGPAYVHAAHEAIQLHGGIGFTWDHDAHLHLRRARTDQLHYGTPREHRRELITAMGW